MLKKQDTHRKTRRWLMIPGLLLILLTAVWIYLGDYYRAEDPAVSAALNSADRVRSEIQQGKQIAFIPEDPAAGLVFYPGGKVQFEAYAPLMKACADRGILCVLLHMPGNLAVLSSDAAKVVFEQFPEVKKWYIGGHSLGGVMACRYAARHEEQLEGVILLAGYPADDLSRTGLRVLSVFGTNDRVMKRDRYEAGKSLLPKDKEEVILTGGNHAQFGCYGTQKGDGIPGISAEEQQRKTAEAVESFVGKAS